MTLTDVACMLQADRLGAAPAFDAAARIGDLHAEALSLQVGLLSRFMPEGH